MTHLNRPIKIPLWIFNEGIDHRIIQHNFILQVLIIFLYLIFPYYFDRKTEGIYCKDHIYFILR